MTNTTPFTHRNNRDGTWDSICTKCFMTVAHGGTEKELAEQEKEHVCCSAMLADRGYFSRKYFYGAENSS